MRNLSTVAILLALMFPGTALAHATGEDYLFLTFRDDSIEGHFEIHFEDLESKLGITLDSELEQARAGVIAAAPQVHAYIEENATIAPPGGEPYAFEFTRQDVLELPQGNFAQFYFRQATGPLPDTLDIRHEMFYDGDRLHRGLVLVEYNAKTNTTYPGEYTAMVFSPTNTEQTLDLTDIPSLMGPRDMIPQGVLHIWIGIDHILFLLALMLPTVLMRRDDGWQPVESFSRAMWNLLKIVTVFTVAHSLTLLLAALDFIRLPSRLVESVIALSIILVALNNIFGKVRESSLFIVFGLGLFHGLGFASVMGHLPFRMVDLMRVVIGFNVGVELGQVAIVAVLFPILFLLRKTSFYQPVVLRGVSAILMVIAGWWFIQRAFGLE
ncbi:MAG: HupE/UreJ family protein [Acidobacteriota bacterium]